MNQHTPTPYWTEPHGLHGEIAVMATTKLGMEITVAICHKANATEQAAFIVRACNSHDALVKALEEIQKNNTGTYDSVRTINTIVNAALALAKES